MQKYKTLHRVGLFVGAAVPLTLTHSAFAATAAGIPQVESFIKSIIDVGTTLAGLVATAFFVVGGFIYITSSGNPQRLEKAKHTLIYSSIGLTIVIAAFVISTVVATIATNSFGS